MRTPSSPWWSTDLATPLAGRFIFGVAPIDCGPVLLLMPFGFHLAMDTLPSAVPLRLRPARHYPRFWIGQPSSDCPRDFNPPEQCAAQRTLWVCPTSRVRSSSAFVLRLPDTARASCFSGEPGISRFPCLACPYVPGSATSRDSCTPRVGGVPDVAFRT